MQVKKFEANSMKEALVMVKHHLGPEAIILSAKENKKGYGLGGEGSVEVTAAVSELVLRKKQLAEKKLNDSSKEKFSQMSASSQKKYIDKVFDNFREDITPPPTFTQKQYIDIPETDGEISVDTVAIGSSVERAEETKQQTMNDSRVRSAVADAMKAGGAFIHEEASKPVIKNGTQVNANVASKDHKIKSLQEEVKALKKLVSNFQNMPQTFVSMHPGANAGLPYEVSFMFEKLTGVGVDEKRTVEILKAAKEEISPVQLRKKSYLNAWVAKYLLDNIATSSKDNMSRYHAFVGPIGQGKTSSLVKYASHLVIRERRRIAIVTCDSQKVGAAEQLRIFAQILNVPFCAVRNKADWDRVQHQLREVDHILIDFPGLSLKTETEKARLNELMPPSGGGRCVHLIQSVLAKDIDAKEIVSRYTDMGVTDLVFTGLDETVQHGVIFNIHKESGLPLHSFGIGPQIPEDFEPATKERVVDLLFKLTKVKQEKGYL